MPETSCSKCGQVLRYRQTHAGRTAKCPNCGQPVNLPFAAEPEAPPAPAAPPAPRPPAPGEEPRPVCPLCNKPVEGGQAVHECPQCGTVHHEACFQMSFKCGECGQTGLQKKAPPAPGAAPPPPRAPGTRAAPGEKVPCRWCGEAIPQEANTCPFCGEGQDRAKGEIAWTNPWENRGTVGWIKGFAQTVKEVIVSPARLFKGTNPSGSHLDPILFVIFLNMGLLLIYIVIQMIAIAKMSPEDIPNMTPENWQAIQQMKNIITAYLFIFGAGFLVCSPIFITADLYIKSAILHLGVMIVGANNSGFAATMRAIAYSSALGVVYIPMSLLSLVAPVLSVVCTLPLAIWALVLFSLSVGEMHGVSYWRGFFAGLAAVMAMCAIFCCGIFMLWSIVAGGRV